MSRSEAATLERLLAHEGWLRHLARHLVADGASGDDLAQETWARVLERPPREVESPRAWLARIVRRVAGERRRDERARTRRERSVAAEHTEASEDPAFAERIEAAARLQQRVARAMLALSEPGRSTVVLRYFEGKSAAQIARAANVPESTVRNRLRRGLAELREALDRESGGDRTQWLTALLPLAAPRPVALHPWPLAAAEVLLVSMKAKVAVPVFLALLVALPFVFRESDAAHPAPAEPEQVELALQSVPQIPPASTERAAAPAPPASVAAAPILVAAPEAPTALQSGVLEVLVVRGGSSADKTGVPVTSGRVWLGLVGVFLPRDPEAEPESTRVAALDSSGIARFSGIPPGHHCAGVQIGSAPIVQAFVTVPAKEGARLVVRLGESGFRGTVYAPDGPAVAGARLQFGGMGEFAERVSAVLWTEADGSYEVLHLPAGAYGIGVDLAGWQDASGGDYNVTADAPAGEIVALAFGHPRGLPVWSGRVRTAAGEAALGELGGGSRGGIYLTRKDKWAYNHGTWKEDGSFALRLEAGTYEVELSPPGRSQRQVVMEALVIEPGRDIERDLVLPGATISGLAPNGRWIAIRSAPKEVPLVALARPADGRFRIDGVPPGRWWLTSETDAVEFVVLASDVAVAVDLR